MESKTITIHDSKGNLHQITGSSESLLQMLRGAGFFIDAPCGGGGRCGKCRVKASGNLSPLTKEEQKLLSEDELKNGIRLACMTYATGDAQVEIISKEEQMKIATLGKQADFVLEPPVAGIPISLQPAHLGRQVDLVTNLLEVLASKGISVDSIDLPIQRKLGNLTKYGNYLYAVIAGRKVLDLFPEPVPLYGFAVDIGTTTVVSYFYHLKDGKLCGVKNGISAQRPFGADVISRIEATIQAGSPEPLQEAILGQLNGMFASLCSECGVDKNQVVAVTIAGNSTMQHLFAGLDPEKIATAPFIQTSSFGTVFTGQEVGLEINPAGQVYILPSVSAYVGGDITAGVLACGMHKDARRALLIDIGTNGEMALGSKDGLLYCSTAAGPAFEGAHIEDGMGGVDGAISVVKTDDSGRIEFKTIGGKPSAGICGSGIIDAVAVMLQVGAIDETGRLCDEDEIPDSYADRLVEDKFLIDKEKGIGLTGKDIREVQLAKAAIAAGIETLLHYAGLQVGDIDVVYLAGGFGSYINKESACAIGLLPKALLDKIEVVGNSAGMGAGIALLSASARGELEALKSVGRYIELSADPFFQDAYVENMMF